MFRQSKSECVYIDVCTCMCSDKKTNMDKSNLVLLKSVQAIDCMVPLNVKRVCVVGSDADEFTTSSSQSKLQSKICKAFIHSTITQAVRNLVAAMYRQTSGLGDGTPSAGDLEMQSGRCEPRDLGLGHAEDRHEQQFGKDGGNGNLNEQVEVDAQSVQGEGNLKLELQSRQGREDNLDQVQGQQRGYLNDDFPSGSRIIELSLVMALGFLGIAYQNNKESKNNPIVTTAVPFKLMMLSLAVTVSASMAGGFFLHFLPCFSKVLHGASLFSLISQLSVLMWVSLPTNLKWVAWCFSLFLLFSLLARILCILCPSRVCVVGSDAEEFTTSSSQSKLQSKICKAIPHSTMTITQALPNLVAAMYRQTFGLGDGTPSAGDVEMQIDPCGPRVHADDNDKQQFGQDARCR